MTVAALLMRPDVVDGDLRVHRRRRVFSHNDDRLAFLGRALHPGPDRFRVANGCGQPDALDGPALAIR